MRRIGAFAALVSLLIASLAFGGGWSRSWGHGGNSAGPSILMVCNLTTQTPGFSATAPCGLSFSRASGASDSVQTGTQTAAVGTSNNYLRYGRRLDADSVGLVFEEGRTNVDLRSRNQGLSWANIGPQTTVTQAVGAGPDGVVTATRLQSTNVAEISQGPFTIAQYTGSGWVRANSGTSGFQQMVSDGAVSSGSFAVLVASVDTTWRRVIVPMTHAATGATRHYFVENSNFFGLGSPGATDLWSDLVQLELGAFATEVVVTTSASVTRAGERLYLASATPYVAAGRLAVEVDLRPKAAPSSYGAAMRFWTRGTDYCEFATTGVLTCSVGGSTNTTAAFSWAQYDSLRIFVAVGGSAASVVSYTVNGGAVVHPTITGSALGSVSTAGALDLLCSGTASQFSAWVTGITIYKGATKPLWAANDNTAIEAMAA